METKYATVVGTKRRKYDVAISNGTTSRVGALSRRINRLSKRLKVNNPTHMYINSMSTVFPSISVTGSIFDLASGIAQGDNYTDRFSTTVLLTRLMIKGVITPGSSAAVPSAVRITVIRGQQGLVFASNMSSTYSPVATNTSTQLIFDKFYPVCSTRATAGYGTPCNINIKLHHKQKYSGTAVNTTTGECLYLIVQSGQPNDTTQPIFYCGHFELYFQPL